MPDDVQQALLRDMLDSGRAIQRYLLGVNWEAFLANPEKQDAVLRRFEIIGEAASRISSETRALFPEIPFRAMRGMRNIIAHDYGEVDLDLVWQSAQHDIPALVTHLTAKPPARLVHFRITHFLFFRFRYSSFEFQNSNFLSPHSPAAFSNIAASSFGCDHCALWSLFSVSTSHPRAFARR